ncbi:MAG: alpha-ribazole phosphatase [Bacteroidota bacterium]|nr:alpha-ribazole phosphatase [Bacteroidota bacterium]
MEIYLIRHTTPAIQKGICYGQTDLDVTASFPEEAAIIQKHLPGSIHHVYSSPLQRCSKLAGHLFPQHTISFHDDLKELHCGSWEMQHWDTIPKNEIDPWMNDFVNVSTPGGESYVDLYERVSRCFLQISKQNRPSAIVTHGGVIRSILARITHTELKDSFGAFKIHYGCVINLRYQDEQWHYDILCNIESPKEQHKPSGFKKH